MIRFLLVLIVVCAAGASWFAWTDYNAYLSKPVALNENGTSFTIERGWSAKRLSIELEKKGIIDKRYWFDLYARLSEKASGIKSGEFVLQG